MNQYNIIKTEPWKAFVGGGEELQNAFAPLATLLWHSFIYTSLVTSEIRNVNNTLLKPQQTIVHLFLSLLHVAEFVTDLPILPSGVISVCV